MAGLDHGGWARGRASCYPLRRGKFASDPWKIGWGSEKMAGEDEIIEPTVLIGDRLRAIRRQQGLSLHDVEARSGKEFKASVLGAYERGERALSVGRLLRLAEIYDVPADQLLPRGHVDIDLTSRRDGEGMVGYTIDLVRLNQIDEPDAHVLARYAATIQLQRQDFNGRMLTIRSDDVRVLAAVLGRRPEDLASRLDEMGLRAAT